MTLLGFEKRWARRIGGALLPSNALGGLLAEVDPGEAVATQVSLLPWYCGAGIRAAIWIIWLSPLWVGDDPTTFGGLDAPAQVEALEALLRSDIYPIRSLTLIFKLAICLGVLGRESVIARVEAYEYGREAFAREARAA